MDLRAPHVEAFLTDVPVRGHVAASTQNQALNALVFLYKQVLEIGLGRLRFGAATRPAPRRVSAPRIEFPFKRHSRLTQLTLLDHDPTGLLTDPPAPP